MSQVDRQGLDGAAVRFETYRILATLSEDQLLVVLAYARSVLGHSAAGDPRTPVMRPSRAEGRA